MKGLLNRGTFIISISASFVTLWLGVSHFFGSASNEGQIGLVFIGGFASFLFFFVLFQEYRLSRKSRYSEAQPHFASAFRLCIEGCLQEFSSGGNPQPPREAQGVCNEVASGFELITGVRCSACIKVIDQPVANFSSDSPRMSVRTLCRDSNSSWRDHESGRVTHWLDANTDFLEILKNKGTPKGRGYLENHLPSAHGYVNTSSEVYGEPAVIGIPIFRNIVRRLSWKLPYTSTIVVPILPIEPSQFDEEPLLAGFLCVDSPSKGAFSHRYDIDILRSLSASLHPMIMSWSDTVWANQSITEETTGGLDHE